MVEPGERPAEFVEGLAKGLAVLEAFDSAHPEMTLSEVARRIGVSPAATRRSLITLGTLGYIGQRGKRFHLRPKVMALGSAFHFSTRIDEILISTFAGESSRWLEEDLIGRVREITDKPVEHVEVGRPARAVAAAVAEGGER